MYAVYAVACLALLRNASGFWPLLVGLCMVGFSFGGYFALLPSFTADYFGSRHVGANYGIMFSAYGLCGFIVPRYFAAIMDEAPLPLQRMETRETALSALVRPVDGCHFVGLG